VAVFLGGSGDNNYHASRGFLEIVGAKIECSRFAYIYYFNVKREAVRHDGLPRDSRKDLQVKSRELTEIVVFIFVRIVSGVILHDIVCQSRNRMTGLVDSHSTLRSFDLYLRTVQGNVLKDRDIFTCFIPDGQIHLANVA
jgi:hypothetical protein